jgi:hypothetical protein
VADKISAHRKFERLHEELTGRIQNGETISQKDFPQVAATVNSFALNQSIYDELNHYDEFGEVLGKHPKLWKLRLEQEVGSYDKLQAYRRRNTLRANISRDKKKLNKMKVYSPEWKKFEKTLERYVLEQKIIESKFDFTTK